MKFPFRYKLLGVINRYLMKGRNFSIFNRHPFVIIRNYLNHIFFRYLSVKDYTIVSTNKGFKLAVRMDDQAAASFLFNIEYSPMETKFIIQQAHNYSTFIDIGASYGYFSLLAETLGFKKILSFEPNPLLAPLINLSIKINNFTKINFFPIAISNVKETLPLSFSDHETSSGILKPDKKNDTKKIEYIYSDYLDTFIYLIDSPALIKIDVEGHEMQVLLGMGKILKIVKPTLLWETRHCHIENIITMLNSFGYHHYIFHKGGLIQFSDISTIRKYPEMIISKL